MLPSAVSGDPHAIRLSVAIPFVIFTIILGYQYVSEKILTKKYFNSLFIILMLFLTIIHCVKYAFSTFAANENAGTYLSYAKKIAVITHDYTQKGYTVYADNNLYPEQHIFYAYWNKIDPRITQKSFLNIQTDQEGFSRPKQFGESIFFELGNLEMVNCKVKEIPKIVFIRKSPIKKIQPITTVQDNTHMYDFAYIYESWQLCEKISK